MGARAQMMALQEGKDDLQKQLDEARAQMMALQEDKDDLQKQLDETRAQMKALQQRRICSATTISRSLSELSDKLENAGSNWAPWDDIKYALDNLSIMREEFDDQATDDKFCGA